MNSTVFVALITSVSTLTGVGISGYITLRISQTNINSQLALANADRVEQRSIAQRQARRDSYVQFLNQVSVVESALDIAWRNNVPPELTNVADITKPITAELDVLSGLANLVILEGPGEVSIAAGNLRARMTIESVDLVGAAKESKGKAPCLQDDQRFVEIQMERAKAKSKMTTAARAALAEAETGTALHANEPNAPDSPR